MDKFENQHDFLEALRTGDREAWKYIQKKGVEMAFRKTHDVDKADEIFQNSALIFINIIRRETTQPDNILGLLNKVIQICYLRTFDEKKAIKLAVESDRIFYFLSETHDRLIVRKIVNESLELLKEDCREFLMDFYFTEMTLRETAEKWDYSLDYAKVRNSRCKKYLRELIKNHPDCKNLWKRKKMLSMSP